MKSKQTSICIAHRSKPPLMRSETARVRGITQFYLPPTRLSTSGMNILPLLHKHSPDGANRAR